MKSNSYLMHINTFFAGQMRILTTRREHSSERKLRLTEEQHKHHRLFSLSENSRAE